MTILELLWSSHCLVEATCLNLLSGYITISALWETEDKTEFAFYLPAASWETNSELSSEDQGLFKPAAIYLN